VADPLAEGCMQVVSEYCLHHPSDSGCDLVALIFEGRVDEPAVLTLFREEGSLDVAYFGPSGSCASETTDVRTLKVEQRGPAMAVSYVGKMEGTYALCEDSKMVAEVRIVPAVGACAYSTEGGATPCEAPECGAGAKAYMNACMQITAEYCMMRPSDKGCQLLTLLFLRNVGSVEKIDLHMSSNAQLDAILIDAACECGQACEDPSLQVLSVSYSAGRAQLEVSSAMAKEAKICASETGASNVKSD
jgi:hypothetical protein